jgi:rhodanese-related sulfurtransferase
MADPDSPSPAQRRLIFNDGSVVERANAWPQRGCPRLSRKSGRSLGASETGIPERPSGGRRFGRGQGHQIPTIKVTSTRRIDRGGSAGSVNVKPAIKHRGRRSEAPPRPGTAGKCVDSEYMVECAAGAQGRHVAAVLTLAYRPVQAVPLCLMHSARRGMKTAAPLPLM